MLYRNRNYNFSNIRLVFDAPGIRRWELRSESGESGFVLVVTSERSSANAVLFARGQQISVDLKPVYKFFADLDAIFDKNRAPIDDLLKIGRAIAGGGTHIVYHLEGSEGSRHNLVAVVSVPGAAEDGLERAFAATNHIDSPWQRNAEVIYYRSFAERSTSVGDVIEDLSAGKKWLVSSLGFKPVS